MTADRKGGGDDVGGITTDELKQKKYGFCGTIWRILSEKFCDRR